MPFVDDENGILEEPSAPEVRHNTFSIYQRTGRPQRSVESFSRYCSIKFSNLIIPLMVPAVLKKFEGLEHSHISFATTLLLPASSSKMESDHS